MRTRSSPLIYLLGSALLLTPGALGCSSSSSPAASDPACTELSLCCLSMKEPATATACVSVASMSPASACASTLLAYQTSGLCSEVGQGIDGGHGVDTGVPCESTLTCTTGTMDSGVKDTGVGPSCQILGNCPEPDATTPPGTDAGHDAGVDADVCGSTPSLHPEVEAGVYCPFTASGSAITCTAGQQCCETPSTTPNGSTCETVGTTCPVTGSIDWTCQGPLDCASSSEGPICCGGGTVAEDNTCGFERGSGFTSTHCALSCDLGEVTICSAATGDCASGTCTPFKVAGIVLGACQ